MGLLVKNDIIRTMAPIIILFPISMGKDPGPGFGDGDGTNMEYKKKAAVVGFRNGGSNACKHVQL